MMMRASYVQQTQGRAPGQAYRVACGGQVHGHGALADSHPHVPGACTGRALERDQRKVVVHGRRRVAGLQARKNSLRTAGSTLSP